jgi:DNA-nicking Smr family endonuclease
MDFAQILEDWEKSSASQNRKSDGTSQDRGCLPSERPAALPAAHPGASVSGVKPPPATQPVRQHPMKVWLQQNPVHDKDRYPDAEHGDGYGTPASERRRLLRLKAPDVTLDLHGLTRDEAWDRLSLFFNDAKRQKLEKILVVHGKGNHSPGEAVLKKTTREFVERCPFAGESGKADARRGGSGATWVLLKL